MRVSFFGGGSDLPEYYEAHGGAVLSTAIDKYVYVILRQLPPFLGYKCEAVYSKIERVDEPRLFQHPLIRECLTFTQTNGVRLNYDADLPSHSGLGTSSSFAVGMLNALYAMKGMTVDADRLAKDAIHVGRVFCNVAGGLQDQIAAAFGGLNKVDFSRDGYVVTPLRVSQSRLGSLASRLMLFYTGMPHFSSDVQKSLRAAIPNKEADLQKIRSFVDRGARVLESSDDLDEFGELLHETWMLKRQLTKQISNGVIDDAYSSALVAGAIGGKILGSGGGGFMLLYVGEGEQASVRCALSHMLEVPFTLEPNGSEIIYSLSDTD